MSTTGPDPPPAADDLRAVFDEAPRYAVGIEDEVMLLDPASLELAPVAEQVLARLGEDPRFKAELPASQVEIITAPTADVSRAAAELMWARSELAEQTAGLATPAVAGVHPFSSGIGELSEHPRYEQILREYGAVARRQLVCALQIHISVGDAARALAVYNAARSYLPWVAALAANAPFYEGRDTGLASVRPKLAELLPRHGIPPPLPSWEDYAEALRWGATSGRFVDLRSWWWELRPHPRFGTLEFRVPDGQTTVAEAAAIASLVQALVAWLGGRHDEGEWLPVAPTWQIAENSWSACRWGIEGTMADLQTGEQRDTRACLESLVRTLEPVAQRLGSAPVLAWASSLIERSGASAQRLIAAEDGVTGVAQWLAARFLEPWEG